MSIDRLVLEVLAKGTRVAGYQIDGPLGRGPRGVVYKATDLERSRSVALKVLAAELGEDRAFRERFLADVTAQRALAHRHVVDVFEAGESEYGLYVAMPLVRGPSLRDLIAARELHAGRPLRILAQIALALDSAHDAGLVHGSLKPQNILLDGGDHAFLGDFGLAGADAGETLDYLAPEQLRGESPTGRSDVYALAAILHECVTGRAPSPTRRPLRAAGGGPQPPQALDRVFEKALASDPEKRPELASEMVGAAALAFETEAASDAGPPPPKPEPATRAEPPKPRRLPIPVGIGFAAVLLVVAAFFIGRSSVGEGHPQPTRPVSAGALVLDAPPDWQRAGRHPELPGARFSDAIALAPRGDPSGGILIAGQVDAIGPTLLDESLFRRLEHTPPRKEAVRLGRLEAYRYRHLKLRGYDRPLTLYAVPNSGGVATVACVNGREAAREFEAACARAAASLRLRGREAYSLGPSESYARRLETAVERLRSARRAALLGQRRARTRGQLASRAGRLAAAYARAARRMRAVPASPAYRRAHRHIVSALRRTERAYGRAARSALRGRRRSYDAARRDARAAEAALGRAFRRLEQVGYEVR